jgi:hypothetical protein
MSIATITEATKLFGLSTRTLRYYEQIGLLKNERTDDYAYRVYSDDTLKRVLKSLSNPLNSSCVYAIITLEMKRHSTMRHKEYPCRKRVLYNPSTGRSRCWRP